MVFRAYSRRRFLARAAQSLGLSLSGTAALSGMSAFATPRPTPIPYGAAVRADALAADAAYRAAIIANCQLIVPESELKWDTLRPTRTDYRFEKADSLVAFAHNNNIAVRGHTLAWYGALPEWVKTISTAVEAQAELVGHIETVVSRYRGIIPSWDVINEPVADSPSTGNVLRSFVWPQQLGQDYIAIALRAAAAADPSAQLVLNEYDIEFKGPRFAARRQALLALLRRLRDCDVPLHAVGLQAHLFAERDIDRDGLQALLAEIAKMNLDVIVTELDVIDYELPGNVTKRDMLVADKARDFLDAVCGVVRPRTLLTWGLSDRYTWVPLYFKRPDGMANRPLPLDVDLQPKPLFAVIDRIRHRPA
ncbi:MAG: endo-1,4-beta-xylanase [Xanthobacteraceae bacterium]